MEYSKVEKFQMSPYFTASTLSHNGTEEGTHKSSKPTKVLRRSSSLLETQLMKKDRCSEKSDDSNVALNLFPDGSSISIPPPPPEPSLVAVYTTHGYPLHVALEDSPCVKATLSLSKLKYY